MRAVLSGMLAACVATVLLLGALSSGSRRAAGTTMVPTPRDHVVFFVPHADDDVLSMGVLMHGLIRSGKTVDVVYYTDGAASRVCKVDRHGICRGDRQCYGWPLARFVAARDAELNASVQALGVTREHVHIYAPDGRRRRDGTMSVPYATAMLQHYHSLPEFRDATFVTMSWLDDNPDHAAAGLALRALVDAGRFPSTQALFTLARWYWAYAYPHRSAHLSTAAAQLRVRRGYPLATELLRCPDQQCLAAIHHAVDAYKAPYGIGYSSVRTYLDVTDGDPEILLHGVQTGRYPIRAAALSGHRGAGYAVTTSLTGAFRLPAFGQFGTDPDRPADAPYLAQSILAGAVGNPFPAGAEVTVRVLSSTGAVLSSVRTPLRDGSYSVRLAVPAGADWVTATSEPSIGLRGTSARLPVAAQQVTAMIGPGLRVSGTDITAGYGDPLAVQVRSSLLGRRITRFATTLDGAGLRPDMLRADRLGIAELTTAITRSGTWRIVSSAPAGALAAVGTSIVVRVTPAGLVVRPSAPTVRLHHGTAMLSGQLGGRSYPIAPAYLRPTRVTAWLHTPGRRAVPLGSTDSAQGGRFTMTVTAPSTGVITYSIAPVRNVYAPVASTASVSLTA
ncbi:MAG TPA: PIG-L family deacetylase [Jatrophihabitans sp.]|jgi:LmbE family N-acetylglucosaminyl deacetylase|uniref:PIG-L deacetylase family protein n=1 Tax=Jatrophihabitans sp. TaxID=1932789 RepID=UPI002E0CEDC8|nr:PIG-L family deacetylase [Jatrophihabitans sp.]